MELVEGRVFWQSQDTEHHVLDVILDICGFLQTLAGVLAWRSSVSHSHRIAHMLVTLGCSRTQTPQAIGRKATQEQMS